MQPKYSQKKFLPEIDNHLKIPHTYTEVARIRDVSNYVDIYLFFQCDQYLVIAVVDDKIEFGDPRYGVDQFEAPLELLTWFPNALEEFIKPSSQGGLHPGAMTSPDEDVGGEMLCIQRAMDAGNNQGGYYIVNRSREDRYMKSLNGYSPMEMSFPENLLYQGGLLNLIKTLGEKYRRGEL